MGDAAGDTLARERSGMSAPRRLTIICTVSIVLFGAIFAALAPALSAEFLRWDDPQTFAANPWTRGLKWSHVAWAFTHAHAGHYHPLTWLSYMLEYELWRLNSPLYHADNIALHAANTVLVYLLALRLFGLAQNTELAGATHDHVAAAFAAAFWGIHPLRVESVAWVTERRDVLSAFFLLLAALAYLRSVEPGRIALRSLGASVLCGAMLLLSVLSKAWGMSFFLIVLLLDIYPLRRVGLSPRGCWPRNGLTLVAQKSHLIAIGLATAVVAAWAQSGVDAAKPLSQWGVGERFVQAVYGLWFYVKATLWPVGLSPLYELPLPLRPFEPRFLIAYLAIGIVAITLISGGKRRPWLLVAAGVYVVSLAPVLGLFQSGEQFVADRYSYLACIGLSILAGAGVRVLDAQTISSGASATRRLVWIGGAAILCALGVLTSAQSRIWRNSFELWEHAMRTTPSLGVRINYADELDLRGDAAGARAEMTRVVADYPGDATAWVVYSDLLVKTGDLPGAEAALLRAIGLPRTPYVGRIKLGQLYATRLDRPREAIAQFLAALDDFDRSGRVPMSGKYYLDMGVQLRRLGDVEGARRALNIASRCVDTRDAAQDERTRLPVAAPHR